MCGLIHSKYRKISIHAPLAGSDGNVGVSADFVLHFNPRSPCGERPDQLYADFAKIMISIHAPLAGSDRLLQRHPCEHRHFNPRSPCGERLGVEVTS